MRKPLAVGIIANPASGKDIRRLVAHGSTFDNNEKVNIVRRILLGMDALGVRDVVFMPDSYNIVGRAAQVADLGLQVRPVEMEVFGDAGDTRTATRAIRDEGVACIVTLGGDGTNRVVVSAARDIVLLPVSTGTNNVFPTMIEGTLAGYAAAAMAHEVTDAVTTRPMLEVVLDGTIRDVALADVVRSSQTWTGSRAVWKVDHVREIVTSQIPAAAIGVSGIASALHPEHIGCDTGVHVVAGPGELRVLCAIGPGLPCWVPVCSHELVPRDGVVSLQRTAGTLALDGEREIELLGTENVQVRRVSDGPAVVDVDAAIAHASESGLFRSNKSTAI